MGCQEPPQSFGPLPSNPPRFISEKVWIPYRGYVVVVSDTKTGTEYMTDGLIKLDSTLEKR